MAFIVPLKGEYQCYTDSFLILPPGSSVHIYASLDNKFTCCFALNIACSLHAVITHYTESNEKKQSAFTSLCGLGYRGRRVQINLPLVSSAVLIDLRFIICRMRAALISGCVINSSINVKQILSDLQAHRTPISFPSLSLSLIVSLCS